MLEQAILTQEHRKDRHTVCAVTDLVAEKHKSSGPLSGNNRIHHLEN